MRFCTFADHKLKLDDMREAIEKLDNYLLTLRPELYESLAPPLEDIDIENLEQKYGIKLPADLRCFYRWKNGQSMDSYDSFVNNSTFLPLEEALETAVENTSMIGSDFEIENWWNEGWIPVFNNGSGDLICYDCAGIFTGKQGQIIQFWHADNDRNVIAPTFEEFISQLNYYYETTKAQNFDEYFEIEEVEGYPKYFTVE